MTGVVFAKDRKGPTTSFQFGFLVEALGLTFLPRDRSNHYDCQDTEVNSRETGVPSLLSPNRPRLTNTACRCEPESHTAR